MSDKKLQPKLAAGTKPKATAVKAPADNEKPFKAATKSAPEKPAKPLAAEPKVEKTVGPKATAVKNVKAEGETGARSSLAGKKINVLDKTIKARPETLRFAVLEVIIKAKKVDDIMGQEVTGKDGKSAKINAGWLNFAATAGNIELI